jgi:transposase
MQKVRVRRIVPPERQKLRRMKRQLKNAVNSRHARIILLSAGGLRNGLIAERVGVTSDWVRKLIHRFNARGISAIEWYPWMHAGSNPKKFFADVVEEIAQVALSPPRQFIGLTRWSLEKLREYLVRQQIVCHISLEWLRILLRRCGIRLRRTKTWKESTDPDFRPKYRKLRRLYAKCPADGRRICVDEFGPLNLQPRHGRCLAGGGKRVERHRATYSRRGGVRHFLAAYDMETDRLFGIFETSKTWREFLKFLKWLRRRYQRSETLHIVLDNYGPHQTQEVQRWANHHKIRFYLTPTNASWLNRIESHFTALKEFALNNSDYRSHEEQQEAINTYLSWRNRRRLLPIMPWTKHQAAVQAALP